MSPGHFLWQFVFLSSSSPISALSCTLLSNEREFVIGCASCFQK